MRTARTRWAVVVATAAAAVAVGLPGGPALAELPFAPGPVTPLAGTPFNMSTGDFNGDGRVDVAVADPFNDELTVLFGDGTGGFPNSRSYTVPRVAQSVPADLNGDGATDLVVVGQGRVGVFLNDGTGAFGDEIPSQLGFDSGGPIAVADFNGDGKVDVAVTGFNPCGHFIVALGDGTGSFTPVTDDVRPGSCPTTMIAADMTGDGVPDLVVNGFASAAYVAVDRMGHIGNRVNVQFPLVDTPTSLAVTDLNEDGRPDVAASFFDVGSAIGVALNTGTGFAAPTMYRGAQSGPFAVATADIDLDGHADVAVADANFVCLLKGDGTGNLELDPFCVHKGVASAGQTLLAAPVDGNASVDLVLLSADGSFALTSLLNSMPVDTVAPIVTPAVRPPDQNGWYRAPVTINWSAVDPAPSSGSPTVPAPTLADVEGQDVLYTSNPSCDPAGNCATGQARLSIDTSAPTVAFAGNIGTYTVDQNITITCTASDPTSGLATSTCPEVVAPAWTQTVGPSSLVASATDRAGNSSGPVTTTFVVTVTGESIKNLIIAWTTGGERNGLLAKLDAITSAPNATGSSGKIGAFNNQVAVALKRGAISQDHADTLTRLIRLV